MCKSAFTLPDALSCCPFFEFILAGAVYPVSELVPVQPDPQRGSSSQEARVLLFNDAVLVSTHRLGKSVCKEFAPLAGVELIRADSGLAMFGLRLLGDNGTCLVFRSNDAGSVAAFLDAARLERDLAVALRAGGAVHVESDL